MCWFTLTPVKPKAKQHRSSSDSSCAEELVRVHRNSSPRFSEVRIKVPSLKLEEGHHHHHHLHAGLQHHHRHPHLHPLHMHPVHMPDIRLEGPGRKRCPPSPCPPPPSRDQSRCRPPPSRTPECEPTYRTQIVEPKPAPTVRDTTRLALERDRGRLRRVAGYELLGKQVPWDWDCVSSTVGSTSGAGGKWTRRRKGSGAGLKYPPFASVEKWM